MIEATKEIKRMLEETKDKVKLELSQMRLDPTRRVAGHSIVMD